MKFITIGYNPDDYSVGPLEPPKAPPGGEMVPTGSWIFDPVLDEVVYNGQMDRTRIEPISDHEVLIWSTWGGGNFPIQWCVLDMNGGPHVTRSGEWTYETFGSSVFAAPRLDYYAATMLPDKRLLFVFNKTYTEIPPGDSPYSPVRKRYQLYFVTLMENDYTTVLDTKQLVSLESDLGTTPQGYRWYPSNNHNEPGISITPIGDKIAVTFPALNILAANTGDLVPYNASGTWPYISYARNTYAVTGVTGVGTYLRYDSNPAATSLLSTDNTTSLNFYPPFHNLYTETRSYLYNFTKTWTETDYGGYFWTDDPSIIAPRRAGLYPQFGPDFCYEIAFGVDFTNIYHGSDYVSQQPQHDYTWVAVGSSVTFVDGTVLTHPPTAVGLRILLHDYDRGSVPCQLVLQGAPESATDFVSPSTPPYNDFGTAGSTYVRALPGFTGDFAQQHGGMRSWTVDFYHASPNPTATPGTGQLIIGARAGSVSGGFPGYTNENATFGYQVEVSGTSLVTHGPTLIDYSCDSPFTPTRTHGADVAWDDNTALSWSNNSTSGYYNSQPLTDPPTGTTRLVAYDTSPTGLVPRSVASYASTSFHGTLQQGLQTPTEGDVQITPAKDGIYVVCETEGSINVTQNNGNWGGIAIYHYPFDGTHLGSPTLLLAEDCMPGADGRVTWEGRARNKRNPDNRLWVAGTAYDSVTNQSNAWIQAFDYTGKRTMNAIAVGPNALYDYNGGWPRSVIAELITPTLGLILLETGQSGTDHHVWIAKLAVKPARLVPEPSNVRTRFF